MHYSNGRKARAGDLVRGKGYNIKHEIVGLLISANPASTSCNCRIATITKDSEVLLNGFPGSQPQEDGSLCFRSNDHQSFVCQVLATIEYGQLDAFVAIDPKTGEVLPPD